MNEEATKKRKAREPFKFPARNLKIILHAPIESTVKKMLQPPVFHQAPLPNKSIMISVNII